MTTTGYDQFTKDMQQETLSELQQLSALAAELHQTDLDVAKLEAQLNQIKEARKDLAERRIPELMDSVGMESFTTKDGFKIKVKEHLRASIAGDRKEPALDWLEQNGHGALIKRTLQVRFNRDQRDEALELKGELEERFGNRFTDERKVEPSTLTAWVREALQNGEAIPMDTFGVFRQRVAHLD